MNKGLNYNNKYEYPDSSGKYSMPTTVLQERIAATSEIEKTLKSFGNPNTSALHFDFPPFGCMSVEKTVLVQEKYTCYSPERILDFFSLFSLPTSHLLIFTNVSLLRLKSDGYKYDLPLDLFWECMNTLQKSKCGYDPEDKVNSLQKLLSRHRRTYSRLNLPDAGKASLS